MQANTIPEFILSATRFLTVGLKESRIAPWSKRVNVGELQFSFLCAPTVSKKGERAMYIEARSVQRDGSSSVRHATVTKAKDGFLYSNFLAMGACYFAFYRGGVGVVQQYRFMDKDGWVRKSSVDNPLLPNINVRINSKGVNGHAIMEEFVKMF